MRKRKFPESPPAKNADGLPWIFGQYAAQTRRWARIKNLLAIPDNLLYNTERNFS
jgi:hypothetical protein